ncbi:MULTISPECIES: hypothetical protein [Nostoc cyanobionts]|uniref:hypothetical protein n=1 Tax=Nostoc cyanobionts TaxID=3123326 RepID=UPI00117CF52B|nr:MULTISPECIES: hypothetical protein [unclassified Nostoc]
MHCSIFGAGRSPYPIAAMICDHGQVSTLFLRGKRECDRILTQLTLPELSLQKKPCVKLSHVLLIPTDVVHQ